MSRMGHMGHREYATYLCKQDMHTKQRFILEEYEEEILNKYHYVTMSASWEDVEEVARYRLALLKKVPKKVKFF